MLPKARRMFCGTMLKRFLPGSPDSADGSVHCRTEETNSLFWWSVGAVLLVPLSLVNETRRAHGVVLARSVQTSPSPAFSATSKIWLDLGRWCVTDVSSNTTSICGPVHDASGSYCLVDSFLRRPTLGWLRECLEGPDDR
jgi:hypothetical protein